MSNVEQLANSLQNKTPWGFEIVEQTSGKLHILCGWDYPDEVAEKVHEIVKDLELEAMVSAEMSIPSAWVSRRVKVRGGYKRW